MQNETESLSTQLMTNRSDDSNLIARAFHHMLKGCLYGGFTLQLPSGAIITHHGSQPGPSISVAFRHWRGLWRCVLDGHLGFAQAYIDGDWTTPDLKAVLDFCMANENLPALKLDRWSPTNLFNRLAHAKRHNSKLGSRRNIAAHYDLGHAFYAAWLDRDLNYSSGLYLSSDDNLQTAQENKLAEVVDLLELKGGENVLEIGCGWGSLAARLIRSKGCAVTGLTLSKDQLVFAQARLRGRPNVDLQLKDYRDADGRFDRIVSIEMIEAVGEQYWPAFFAKLRAGLNEDGIALLQAITIETSRFEGYRRHPDFVQRYIFPGGMLPTVDIIAEEARRAGLRLIFKHHFGESYGRTLNAWRTRFEASWPQIAQLGFDQRFKRMWEFYLAYCQVGFETNAIDVGLYKFEPI